MIKKTQQTVIPNMNFRLTLGGKNIPCKSIRGIQKEREAEYIQEGGVNDYVHIRPKPASKASTLQIEQYLTERFEDVLPVGKVLEDYLVLEVGGMYQFLFKGCMVIAKSYGDLDAEKGGILSETTTIAYERMEAKNC